MNGTLPNWLKHAALSIGLTLAFGWAFGRVAGGCFATLWFWRGEAGEKSKDWDAPRRPRSDWNPFDPRWTRDDRLDLISGVVAAWVTVLVLAFIH